MGEVGLQSILSLTGLYSFPSLLHIGVLSHFYCQIPDCVFQIWYSAATAQRLFTWSVTFLDFTISHKEDGAAVSAPRVRTRGGNAAANASNVYDRIAASVFPVRERNNLGGMEHMDLRANSGSATSCGLLPLRACRLRVVVCLLREDRL